MQLTEPRHDKIAEDTVLGCCLFEGFNAFAKAQAYITTPDVFYDEDNRRIWETMVELYEAGTPIDSIMVAHRLRNTGKSTSGDNWPYIVETRQRMHFNGAMLQHYSLLLVEDYIHRTTQSGILDLSKNADPLAIAQDIEAKIKKALSMKSVDDWADASMLAIELIDRREKIASGIEFGVKTGYREFDLLTGGLEPGLIIIAARPSMGKTAFATSLIMRMALAGTPVGILSLEMPNIQIAGRYIAIMSKVEFWRVFRNKHTPEQADKVNQDITAFAQLPIYTSDKTNVTISDIRYKAEKLVKRGGKLLVIDYLQLVDSDTGKKNETREREVAKLTGFLKKLSKELDIPIVVLAQLNRESEKGGGVSAPGKLSQLRESGAIEQDADMGIIVDRPYKRGQITDEAGNSTINVANIIIEKYRNGETKTLSMIYNPEYMMFDDVPVPGDFTAMGRIKPDYEKTPVITLPNDNAPF